MKYIKPEAIVYKIDGEKKWVEVYFENERFVWVPSLAEIGQISAMIGVCEDEKYNWPKRKVKGAKMVIEFLEDAITLSSDTKEKILELAKEYQIPKAVDEPADKA